MYYILITLLFVLWTSFYFYCKQIFAYWQKRDLPFIEPSMRWDNLKKLWSMPPVELFMDYYNILKKRGVKHGGFFILTKPAYMPIAPEIIRNIMIKDYHHFSSRGLYFNDEAQPTMRNLFFSEGEQWKNLRQNVTPTFTSGKIKMMFNTVMDCLTPLNEVLKVICQKNETFEAKNLIAGFAIDVIGRCTLGIECNSLDNPNSDFKKFGDMTFYETPFKALRNIFAYCYQDLAKKLGILFMDKEANEFFVKVATNTYNYRKKNNIKRNDFMQLLMELKDKDNDFNEKIKPITMDELIAQVILFFIAGYDTTSLTLSFCLFNLASHLDVQEKLRKEIQNVMEKYNGEITFDSLHDMIYMEQVINETMRLYPIGPVIGRCCTKDYQVPSTDIIIEKGTKILIPNWGLHRDPEHFPDPSKFDPERFSEENKSRIEQGTFLPFGEGPRLCLGIRFAMMQMKMCLARLLKDFEFSVNPKTKVPLEMGFGFVVTVKGGIWLNAKTIS